MKIHIKQLNICPMRKVNLHQYKEALKINGHHLVESEEDADKVLVWTCAVREDFHDNSIDVIKHLENDGHQVIAAGCLPSINPDFIKESFKGEVLHYNNDTKEFNEIFGCSLEEAPYPVAELPIEVPLEEYRQLHPDTKIGNDDQYIKLFISEGCTRKCSYCTEIRAFPPYQSYPINKIVSKARDIIKKTGIKKLALFGDDIGAYGYDSGVNIIDLIDELVAIDPDVQISLKQIHPLSWKKHFKKISALIERKKIFQILVPIQSANNRILALMKRNYSVEILDFLFESVKDYPELELETHIIAGFPTETEEEWEETVAFICKYNFRYVMGNIYMAGPGTLAAEMKGQIDPEQKKQRMLTGVSVMESKGVVVGHNLSWRSKEHITHKKIDFTEL